MQWSYNMANKSQAKFTVKTNMRHCKSHVKINTSQVKVPIKTNMSQVSYSGPSCPVIPLCNDKWKSPDSPPVVSASRYTYQKSLCIFLVSVPHYIKITRTKRLSICGVLAWDHQNAVTIFWVHIVTNHRIEKFPHLCSQGKCFRDYQQILAKFYNLVKSGVLRSNLYLCCSSLSCNSSQSLCNVQEALFCIHTLYSAYILHLDIWLPPLAATYWLTPNQ